MVRETMEIHKAFSHCNTPPKSTSRCFLSAEVDGRISISTRTRGIRVGRSRGVLGVGQLCPQGLQLPLGLGVGGPLLLQLGPRLVQHRPRRGLRLRRPGDRVKGPLVTAVWPDISAPQKRQRRFG